MSTAWYPCELLPSPDGFFLFLRSPSSKRLTVGSVVSPINLAPAAPAEPGGSGSAKGQGASGQTVVPKFVKAKRFVLKHSSQ